MLITVAAVALSIAASVAIAYGVYRFSGRRSMTGDPFAEPDESQLPLHRL